MQIKEVPIDTIFPYPENPREIEDSQFEKLQKSIKEFGFVEPLVVNVREHSDFKPEEKVPTIVGGNMRFRAAKALGMKEVPIVEVNLDRTKEMALNIGLNRIAGRWDVGKLEKLVYDLSNTDLDIDLDLTGLEDWELKLYNPGKDDNFPENLEGIDEKTMPGKLKTTNECPKCGYKW
jgi:ParB-like chromosome segregation protein Spo0J